MLIFSRAKKIKEDRMKSIKRNVLVMAVFIAALWVSACSSTPNKPLEPSENLDWQDSAIGAPIPDWVRKAGQNEVAMENEPGFENSYCFVVRAEEGSKDYAVGWVTNNANGSGRVSIMVANTVVSAAEASEGESLGEGSGSKTDGSAGKVDSKFGGLRTAMSNVSFSGLRMAGQFWTLTRNRASKKPPYYVAYALWIIDKDKLDKQVEGYIQNFVTKNNEVMSDAERQTYAELIDDVRKNGMFGGKNK
jgi:hypothetical protein